MAAEAARVLLVEDNPEDIAIISRLLSQYERAAFDVTAVNSTNQCIEQLQAEGADLLLLDNSLPGDDGIEFLRRLAGITFLPPVIVVTGQGSERVAADAIRSGAFSYLPKDSLTPDLLGRTAQEALDEARLEEVLSPFDRDIIYALTAAAEGKDPTLRGHLERMTAYAVLLGRAVKLGEDDMLTLRCGALLHDIGKLAVSAEVLLKPGRLTQDEWVEVHRHPLVGERIAAALQVAPDVGPIIRHHHERWDGTGYADGLAGESIPFLARVVSVADAFDAMTSHRPYRRAPPVQEAARRLQRGAGRQWDAALIETFLDVVEREGVAEQLRTARRLDFAA
jgi:putative two-component system response regulator